MHLNKAFAFILGIQLLLPAGCWAASVSSGVSGVQGGTVGIAPVNGGSITQGAVNPNVGFDQSAAGPGGFGANGGMGNFAAGANTGNEAVTSGLSANSGLFPSANGQGFTNQFGQFIPSTALNQLNSFGVNANTPFGFGQQGLINSGWWGNLGSGGGLRAALGAGMFGGPTETMRGNIINGTLMSPRVNSVSGVLEGFGPTIKAGPGGKVVGGARGEMKEWAPTYAVAAANARLNRMAEAGDRARAAVAASHLAYVVRGKMVSSLPAHVMNASLVNYDNGPVLLP